MAYPYPPPAPMYYPPHPGSNSMATFSFISGLTGWVIGLLTLCANILVLVLSVATMGIGSFLGICTTAVSIISPIAWLIAIITGHIAKGQINRTGEAGSGSATMGLIMGYIGLGLILGGICIFTILTILSLAGVAISIPFLSNPSFWSP
jgi:hypothetical protein